MKSMRILTFATAAAVVAAEAVQYYDAFKQAHAPALAARDDCTKLPALCTGAVTVSGTGMTLTYLCPATSQVPVSTVHVTVTATTTVTSLPESSVFVDNPLGSAIGPTELADVPPTGTPHPPAPPHMSTEVTSTTTIHSTLTTSKTVTVTRKTSSPSADVPSPTAPAPTPVVPSSMPPFTLVTPSASHNASSATITLAPVPASSTTRCQHWEACWEPCISGACPPLNKGPTSINASYWATASITKPSEWPSTLLNASSTGTAPLSNRPVHTSIATRDYVKLPIPRNATATHGYAFPTPHVLRDVESSESAKPRKTGGVGSTSVNVAALIGGVIAAVYFA
ncbi:hypothetical protein BDU57DRAFT_38602 [Ampelomyces quisqualis]|uniref:Uncharacterized protein n=1 Tax=Ampelomyces quisqualis TaxID=50730 RepID=A0A6A5QZB0_AMPQU|nr:hypothetical protein BDU57DRAFT_38602 [Ampelomyces quisqualis]